jgi:hypothetical protein
VKKEGGMYSTADREFQAERGPFRRRIFDFHASFVHAGNSLRDRQPHPGAAVFSAEKRLKYAGQHIFGNPATIVGNPDNHPVVIFKNFNYKPSTPCHGIHGIQKKVGENLLQLVRVGSYGLWYAMILSVNLDFPGLDLGSEGFDGIIDHLIDLNI